MRRRAGALVVLLVAAGALVGGATESAGAAGSVVSIGDVSVWEGDSGPLRSGSVALTLSEPAATTVSVQYTLVAGSATARSDYKPIAAAKTVSFRPGVVKKFVPVVVYSDSVDEADETLLVRLAYPTDGASIGDEEGTVTILDDDPNTELGVAVSDASVWEGNGTKPRAAKIWVSLTDPAPSMVKVTVATAAGTATAGSDFKPVSKLVTFLTGQVKKPVTLTTYPDPDFEHDETFTISLSGPSGAALADANGSLTIRNDDAPPPLQNAVRVSAGYYHSCAVLADGTIRCWGPNGNGELGNGTTASSTTGVEVSGISDAVSVTTGEGHSCAVLADGTIRCWGFNEFGQLGDGTTTSSNVPVTVLGITNAVTVNAGQGHSCAVLADGSVRCWGWNFPNGHLGNGTTINSNVPVTVFGITNAVSVSAGYQFSCAVLADGTARCWGWNGFGQLGDGTTTSSSVPVNVSGITNAVSISTGGYHACAVLADGTLRCWGRNEYGNLVGQLGDGTSVAFSPAPVNVVGIINAVGVDAGSLHSCAVLADGTARCWGLNEVGQLGDGTTTSSNVPVTVTGIANAATVSAGRAHSCVVIRDGTVRCSGWNIYGMLGDGTTTDSFVPVVVRSR